MLQPLVIFVGFFIVLFAVLQNDSQFQVDTLIAIEILISVSTWVVCLVYMRSNWAEGTLEAGLAPPPESYNRSQQAQEDLLKSIPAPLIIMKVLLSHSMRPKPEPDASHMRALKPQSPKRPHPAPEYQTKEKIFEIFVVTDMLAKKLERLQKLANRMYAPDQNADQDLCEMFSLNTRQLSGSATQIRLISTRDVRQREQEMGSYS